MNASGKSEKTEDNSEASHTDTVLSTDFVLPTVTEIKTELEDIPSISVIPVSWDYFLKKPDLEEHSIVTTKNDITMENDDDLHFNGFHRSDTTVGHPQDVTVKQGVEEEGKFGDASCELLNLPRVTKIKVEPTSENGPSVTMLPSSWDCCDDPDSGTGVVPKHKGEMLESEELSDISREKMVATKISSYIRRSSRLADKVVNITRKLLYPQNYFQMYTTFISCPVLLHYHHSFLTIILTLLNPCMNQTVHMLKKIIQMENLKLLM